MSMNIPAFIRTRIESKVTIFLVRTRRYIDSQGKLNINSKRIQISAFYYFADKETLHYPFFLLLEASASLFFFFHLF